LFAKCGQKALVRIQYCARMTDSHMVSHVHGV
jgi:hypothetical protein